MVKKIQIKYIFFFIFFALFLLIFGSGNIISPFYGDLSLIDEGQFLAWISHMNAGEFLYKDTYAAYGPLLIYPYYLISKLFEPTFFTLRIFYGVIGVLFSISIVILILNRLKVSFFIQFYAAFMLCFIPGFGLRQASGLLAIFMSHLAFNKQSYLWSFLTGISLALSFLISSDMGIFSFLVILALAFVKFLNIKDYFTYFKKVGLIILGCILILFVFFIFTSYEGWFHYYQSSILDDLVSYSGIGIPIGKKFPNALELFPQNLSFLSFTKYILSKEILNYWLISFYILSLVYFFIKFMLKKVNESDLLAFGITLFGILLSTILIGRIGNFNFIIPIVFILFAYFLSLIIKYSRKTKIRNDKIFSYFIVLLILLFSLRMISIYRPHFGKIPIAIAQVSFENKGYGIGNVFISKNQAEEIQFIQKFVNENTNKNDKLFFLSNNPGMYLLINRVSPTRFDLPEVANTKEKRLEIIKDLEKDKTKYIIEYTKAYDVDDISNRVRLPEVMDYIMLNYDVSQIGQFIIYTRKYSDISYFMK